MDYKEYKEVYQKLLTDDILNDGEKEKEKNLNMMNDFLEKYPTIIPKDRNPATPVFELSVKELYKRTLQTIIDIINDISELVTQKDYMSQTAFRRNAFKIFTVPKRRLYIGIILIIISFMLYFIDSSA